MAWHLGSRDLLESVWPVCRCPGQAPHTGPYSIPATVNRRHDGDNILPSERVVHFGLTPGPSGGLFTLCQPDSGARLSPSCSDRFVKRGCPDVGQCPFSEAPGGLENLQPPSVSWLRTQDTPVCGLGQPGSSAGPRTLVIFTWAPGRAVPRASSQDTRTEVGK